MPSFEKSVSKTGSANSGSAYDKLLAICKSDSTNQDKSIVSRAGKISISLKDSHSFYDSVASMDADLYGSSASADLTNIFYPFITKKDRLDQGGLPGFHPNAPDTKTASSVASGDLQAFLPFKWSPTETTKVVDRYRAPSGDSLSSVMSSDINMINIEQFRDISNMRTIGIRLPAMAVGWGYTLGSRTPMPSGTAADAAGLPSGTKVFRGGYKEGWQVDPSNYIVAPIDFHYDLDRHVWTCGNTKVDFPKGQYQYMVYQNVTTNETGFDFVRSHPIIVVDPGP